MSPTWIVWKDDPVDDVYHAGGLGVGVCKLVLPDDLNLVQEGGYLGLLSLFVVHLYLHRPPSVDGRLHRRVVLVLARLPRLVVLELVLLAGHKVVHEEAAREALVLLHALPDLAHQLGLLVVLFRVERHGLHYFEGVVVGHVESAAVRVLRNAIQDRVL